MNDSRPADDPADQGTGSEETGLELRPESPSPLESPAGAGSAADGSKPEIGELEGLRRERVQLSEQLLRRRAEFENYKRRVERERQQWTADAEAALLEGLVPSLDHLEQALKSVGDNEAIRTGLELIQRDLTTYLTKQGLTVLDPIGRLFDPLTEQALAHEVAEGVPDGTVIEVFRKGYLHKERLLRPALVKVAKAAAETQATVGGSEGDPEAVH
jgi:molecular chaperone GrpE